MSEEVIMDTSETAGHQSPIRYLAITTEDGVGFLIRVTGESDRMISGVEIDRTGEEVTGREFDRRVRLVEKAAIAEKVEMRMNVVYGRIERAR